MTSFDEIVPHNGVVADLRVSSKKQLLQELSERAGQLFGLDRRDVFETLLERERLGSTGVDLDEIRGARIFAPIDQSHRSKVSHLLTTSQVL